MAKFEAFSRIDNAESLHCPACGTAVGEIRYLYESEKGQSYFYRCGCGFIFARPVLIPELTQRQMDGVDNAEMFNSPFMKTLYVRLFIRREVDQIRKLKKGSGLRLLDIGCGTGWTTKVYKDQGFQVTGLEPSMVRAKIARDKYDIAIINDYLENLPDHSGPYDVIVLRHIIEHFAEPDAIMQKVRALLADGGLVLVVVPNINCLGRYIFGTKWTWVLPWHCNFFTPSSAGFFMKRLGFSVVSQYQTPSPLYFPDSFLRKFPYSFLKKLVSRHKISAMLLSSPIAVVGSLLGMGDNINIFALKKGVTDSVAMEQPGIDAVGTD